MSSLTKTRAVESDSIGGGADLLFAGWTLGPQQSVAQDGAVGVGGGLPAHLNGGRRQSQCSERLHLVGNLDCRHTGTRLRPLQGQNEAVTTLQTHFC